MGLEYPTRTGAPVGADACAHHRVCSGSPIGKLAGNRSSSLLRSCVWVWSTYHRTPPRKAGRFSGQDFARQLDGTLRCPADQKLIPHEPRRETDGSLRVVYAASIRSCRPCRLREQCQWNGSETRKPRQVSVLLHPLIVGKEPLLWQDWSRRVHRRACIRLLRHQRVETRVSSAEGITTAPPSALPVPLS